MLDQFEIFQMDQKEFCIYHYINNTENIFSGQSNHAIYENENCVNLVISSNNLEDKIRCDDEFIKLKNFTLLDHCYDKLNSNTLNNFHHLLEAETEDSL